MSNCIFTIGSVTQAMKASKLLNSYSIPTEITKLSESNRGKGCIYGIRFSCANAGNISRILSAANIRYEEYRG